MIVRVSFFSFVLVLINQFVVFAAFPLTGTQRYLLGTNTGSYPYDPNDDGNLIYPPIPDYLEFRGCIDDSVGRNWFYFYDKNYRRLFGFNFGYYPTLDGMTSYAFYNNFNVRTDAGAPVYPGLNVGIDKGLDSCFQSVDECTVGNLTNANDMLCEHNYHGGNMTIDGKRRQY